MIYIEEIQLNNSSVVIKISGVLDMDSKEDLREIFTRHFKSKKNISVDLTNIVHISREGRAFLKEFGNSIIIQEREI